MHFFPTRPLRACVAALTLCSAVALANAAADVSSSASNGNLIDPRGKLTLSDAIAAALQRNPALRSARFEIQSAEARITQAGLRPNPEFGISLENFSGNGSVQGKDALETTLTLSQVIELGDKRAHRTDVARHGRDTATLMVEAQQLDVLAEITRRFIDVAADQQQLLLAHRGTDLSRQMTEAINQRVAAARAPEAEKSRASIALGRAKLAEREAEQALLSARQQLAATWGSIDARFGDVQADLFALPPIASFDSLMSQLKNSPDLQRFASEARLRDAEWQLAKAEAKSNITVGAGLRRFEATNDTGFVVDFSMPLPTGNRNQGAIREASIRREQLNADQDTALINAQVTLFGFYQQLQQARSNLASLREQLIPQAEAASAQMRDGYERGRFSWLEYADAQRELLDLQFEAIQTAATYHRVLAEIERLTRAPLAQASK